jgi:hypothetical protein
MHEPRCEVSCRAGLPGWQLRQQAEIHCSAPVAFSFHVQHPRAAAASMRNCCCVSSLCITTTHSLCSLKQFSWGHLFSSTKHKKTFGNCCCCVVQLP